ncbi:MAG: terminase small subunit [Bacillota bacterium]
MSPKQKRFCQEYLIDQNVRDATLRAGYQNENHGSKLLEQEAIKTYLLQLIAEAEAVEQLEAEQLAETEAVAVEAVEQLEVELSAEEVAVAEEVEVVAEEAVEQSEEVEAEAEEEAVETIAGADEVLSYLTDVMRGRSESDILVVVAEGAGVTKPETVTKTPDHKERLKAAELLGKNHTLFTQKKKKESEDVLVIIPGEEELKD